MTPTPKNPSPKSPKRLRTRIKHDVIHPADYLHYSNPRACEDCSHFALTEERCTLGYNSEHHRRAYQEQCYLLSGQIAFCRFLEID